MLNLNIELRDLITRLIKNEFEEIYGIACKVSDVREEEIEGWVCDCMPINNKAQIRAVRLKAEPDGGVLVIPSDGSVVFVTMESDEEAFVSMYGKIDRIEYLDGTNGGVVKVAELVEKLNVLEKRMFEHQHLSAAPLSPTTPDPATNPLIIETEVEDLENENFTH